MVVWFIIYGIGCLVASAILNKYWHDEFREYNVLWSAGGSLLWVIWLPLWILGTLGKLIIKALEED